MNLMGTIVRPSLATLLPSHLERRKMMNNFEFNPEMPVESDTVRLIIKVTDPNGAVGWYTYDIADQGLRDLLTNWANGTNATVVGSQVFKQGTNL